MDASRKRAGFDAFRSAMTTEGCFIGVHQVAGWLGERNAVAKYSIDQIPFDSFDKWYFDSDQDKLAHRSGKFFSIRGIEGTHPRAGRIFQPIIDQPEVGILGIIAKKFDGVLHFLIQAKVEPGNINGGQLSPTVQATKSNYTKVHQGALPRYLEYFLDTSSSRIILDQLQSEQGSFFYKKRNRNIIIEIEHDVELHEDFCWLTLGQLKQLLKIDNLVNMDARSVLSAIPYGEEAEASTRQVACGSGSATDDFGVDLIKSLHAEDRASASLADIISWFTEQRIRCELSVALTGLSTLPGWKRTPVDIRPDQGGYFSVIGVSMQTRNREVASWTQPLIKPAEKGLIGFLVKRINGVLHFLVQARVEIGNFDAVEMAPSVQYLAGNPLNSLRPEEEGLRQLLLSARGDRVKARVTLSEEGGRFYHYQNENRIVQLDDSDLIDIPSNYKWMTFGQMLTLIRFNNVFNMEARSLLACLSFCQMK